MDYRINSVLYKMGRNGGDFQKDKIVTGLWQYRRKLQTERISFSQSDQG